MAPSLPTIASVSLEDSRQDPPPGRQGAILWPGSGKEVLESDRIAVEPPWDLVISRLWWVRWRRAADRPHRQQVLSDPAIHLTVEASGDEAPMHGHATPAALLHGTVTRVFTVDLPTSGRVHGVAFHPGGLAALLDREVGDLTDQVVAAAQVLGPQVEVWRAAVLAESDEERRRALTLDWLTASLATRLAAAQQDQNYRLVREATDLMADRTWTDVASVAEAVHVAPRTLQRLFHRYVGTTPLWVLRRHRLLDAAQALHGGSAVDLADLAHELGWADHAHFSRDFTAVIGVPPSTYRSGSARQG